MTYFSELGLAEPILRALGTKGYSDPTPIQREAIPALLEGRDLLGIAQTGTGKTAAFSLPSLHRLAAEPKGRQNAAWMLLSAEWIGAEEAREMGLVWKVCEPDDLLPTARRYAETLAARPISSLTAVKETMVAPLRDEIAAARARENDCFAALMGGPANLEALTAFAEGREPDFTALPAGW